MKPSVRRLTAMTCRAYKALVRLTAVAAVVLTAAGCSGTAERQRMLGLLEQAEEKNRNYESLAGDSVLKDVAAFMDAHGTAHDQMRAHYILGCHYRDREQASEALEQFHEAIDRADTTAADCDFRTLSRIHRQAADLFLFQNLPYEALDEYNNGYLFAKKANDTLTWICTYERQNYVYDLLGQTDKAIEILEEAYEFYKQYGYTTHAANCVGSLVLYYSNKGQYAKVKQYIDIFETYSNLFSNGKPTPGHELYYYYKGTYYSGINKMDSAEYYFRQELRESKDINNREAAYKGLYNVFLKVALPDSAARYADLCYRTSEEQFLSSHTEKLSQMQAIYNYSHNQQLARRKTLEASRNERRFIVTSAVGTFCVIVLIAILVVYRRRRIEEKRQLQAEYQHIIEMQERAKYDIVQMKEEETEMLLLQKAQEIEDLQKQIEQMNLAEPVLLPLSDEILQSDIYNRLRYISVHPKESVSNQEWNSLHSMIQRHAGTFYNALKSFVALKDEELNLCMLIWLQFGLSELCVLLDMSPQHLSVKRRRLLKKMFDREGKPEEFDKLIRSMK